MNRRLSLSSLAVASLLAAGLTVAAAPAQSATPSAPRAPADASNEGLFFPITPARLLDTRNGTGGARRMTAGSTITLQVAGRGGLPSTGISTVTMTLTAVTPSASTYLTAYPSGVARPNASSINVTAGVIRANTVTLPVGSDGKVRIYNHAGTIDVLSDVTGFYATGSLTSGHGAGSGISVFNLRLEDTRQWHGALRPGETLTVDSYGSSIDSAAYVNVTAVAPSANGYLKAWSGTGSPNISTVNFRAGQPAVANTTVVGLRTSGGSRVFSVQNVSSGKVQVVVDLLASYDTSNLYTRFYPITPTRVLDTRNGTGVPRGTLLSGNSTVKLPSSLQSSDSRLVEGIVGNATIVKPSASDYLLFWDGGNYKPNTSTVNARAGEIIANGMMSETNTDSGNVTVYNHTGRTDAVLDVSGVLAIDW